MKDVDLLYHEATFAESEKTRAKSTFHSTAKEAATMAKEAGAKRLVIGHYSSRYDDSTPLQNEANEIFPSTECANEGDVFTI
jgi:ribonuclease Z